MTEATSSFTADIMPPPIPAKNDPVPVLPAMPRQCTAALPIGALGITRDTWAKVIIWFIPVIFACGTLFYSFRNMDDRVGENTGAIKMFSEKQSQMYTEQQVHVFKLDAIQTEQAELKKDIEEVDNKLDDQKGDLAAIKAKLGVKERREDR